MLQAESASQRIMLLQVLQATDDTNGSFLKKFISFHGLRLLWSWMVDSSDLDSSEGLQFRMKVHINRGFATVVLYHSTCVHYPLMWSMECTKNV